MKKNKVPFNYTYPIVFIIEMQNVYIVWSSPNSISVPTQ